MEAIKFSERVIIDESAQVVFDYTQDYNNRLTWDTFLKKADLINGAAKAAKGVKAYCVAQNGLGMETEYITYNPPKVTAITMPHGPYLFKAFSGSWTFKELSPMQTEVIFLYSFTLRFPFALIKNFLKSNLQKNVRQRLADLKLAVKDNNR